MTKYLMCIYWGHMCTFIPNMKSSILWLGGLCTDVNDTNNTDNYAQWTNHDYIGSFGKIPNEPKKKKKKKKTIKCKPFQMETLTNSHIYTNE